MKTVWELVRRTFHEFNADQCGAHAAAIAYYVLFSVIPLLSVMVTVFGFILRDPKVQRDVVEGVLAEVPLRAGRGENMIIDAIRGVAEISAPITVLGLLGLLWTATGLFGAVRGALNVAWDTEKTRSFHQQKAIDTAALLGLTLLIAGSIAGSTLLHTIAGWGESWLGPRNLTLEPMVRVAGWLLPAIVTYVGFLLLYRYVPHVAHGFADVWPGALLATVLFEGSKHGFTFYVANFSRHQVVYGALGAVMLFMLWTYVSAIVLLIGAEFSSEYERWRAARAARAAAAIVERAAAGG